MEQNADTEILADSTYLGGKAWTAYAWVTVIGLLVIAGCYVLMKLGNNAWWPFLAAGIVAAFGLVVYQTLLIGSYELYYNDLGIWRKSGIFPWQRGVAGVKWRDMDEAVYQQTIWSWFSNSYSIRIGHRFTKSSEIYMADMENGDQIVKKINEIHTDMIRRGLIQ